MQVADPCTVFQQPIVGGVGWTHPTEKQVCGEPTDHTQQCRVVFELGVEVDDEGCGLYVDDHSLGIGLPNR